MFSHASLVTWSVVQAALAQLLAQFFMQCHLHCVKITQAVVIVANHALRTLRTFRTLHDGGPWKTGLRHDIT